MPRPVPLPAEADVACAGALCLDHLLEVPRFPRPDDKFPVDRVLLQAGGQAATAAAALARWGLRVRFLGFVGDDEAGRTCRATLEQHGVEASGCHALPGIPTHQAFVLADPEGRRTILYRRPPELGSQPYPHPGAGWVHLDGQDPGPALDLAHRCRAEGVPVSLDLEGPPQESEELIRLCHVVVADGPSGAFLAEDPAEAARRLAAMGPWLAGVTLGSRGACGWCEGEALWAEAPEVEVKDTTGAGDVFHAGVVFGLLRGWSPARTWRFATTAASLSCRVLGGMPGIPALEEAGVGDPKRPESGP